MDDDRLDKIEAVSSTACEPAVMSHSEDRRIPLGCTIALMVLLFFALIPVFFVGIWVLACYVGWVTLA